MWNFIGGIAGIMIIVLFLALPAFVYINKPRLPRVILWADKLLTLIGMGSLISVDGFNEHSLSFFSSNRKLLFWARIIVLLVAFMILPYIYGLSQMFDLSIFHLTIVIGLVEFAALIGIAVTLSDSRSFEHEFAASTFFVLLGFMGLPLGIDLLDQLPALSGFQIVVSILASCLLVIMWWQMRRYKDLSGITEIEYLILNSMWVLSYAFYMIHSAI